MSESNGIISESQASQIRNLLDKIGLHEEKIRNAERQADAWRDEIAGWRSQIDDILKDADPEHHANKLFLIATGIEPKQRGKEKKSAMVGTNRQKITTAIENHPEGATFEDILVETGIPKPSLHSELSKGGLELYGIEKTGRGKDARYFLKQSRVRMG